MLASTPLLNIIDKIKHTFKKAEQDFQQNFGDYAYYKEVLDSLIKYKKEYMQASQRYYQAQHVFQNKYKNKQPVIDSERQLSRKLLDTYILINTVLTTPGSTVEKEYQYQITAINAVIAFCDMEEGSPVRQPNTSRKHPATNGRQFAFFALEILECQKISDLKTTILLDPLPVTLSTSMSCHIQKICGLDAASARRSWRARQHY
ncbi:hypothetical protein BDV09DRAFT_190794 [Aspergillus tetrazonus]